MRKRPRRRHQAVGALLLLAAGNTLAAEDEKNMYLHGALVAEPCVIPPESENITLDFGAIVDKYLYANIRSPGEAFAIQLDECDPAIAESISFTFKGMENAALPGYLALEGGTAKGVAIGLETEKGEFLPLNKPGEKQALEAGTNQVQFKAFVQGEPEALENGKIERGEFVASATFEMNYE
jgi:type 1 fimbria pilin